MVTGKKVTGRVHDFICFVSEYLGKHVESEKCIYQQGTLHKLSTAALELGAIKMTIPERGTILLSQAIASCTLLMPPSIKLCNQFYCHLWICRSEKQPIHVRYIRSEATLPQVGH
ncbi:hypothetical protein EMCRGX_G007908 [Ephydatia muelleri]